MNRLNKEIKEKYIRLLHEICMMETPSGDPNRINALVDRMERFAKENGYAAERFPFEKAGDFLLIRSGENRTEKPVLMMAHMDTVHPVGAFGKEVVTYDGDWMRGPGVMDCKGGIATALCVMEQLKNNCERPVWLLLTSDEEATGCYSGEPGYDVIRHIARKAAAVFNMEPGRYDEITVGRKGILCMRMEIKGIPAHAGNGYFEAASAIKEAAHAVLEIENLSRKGGITYNCGLIRGGTAINVVPDFCGIDIDIRVSTMEEMAEAQERMREVSGHCVVKDTVRKVRVTAKRPPMQVTDPNLQLLRKWNESAKALGMPEYRQLIRGGGSDAAYTVLEGIPTLCSCGAVGENEHTRKERLDLSSLDDRVRLLCGVIQNL